MALQVQNLGLKHKKEKAQMARFTMTVGVIEDIQVLGSVLLKLLGGKLAPKLVCFVLRKELLKLQ